MDNLITSRENPKIKEYIRLRDKRQEREKSGLFVLEGRRIIFDAVGENVPLSAVYASEGFASRFPEEFETLLSRFPGRVFGVTGEVSRKLSETEEPQGLYAVAPRLDKKLYLDKIEAKGRFLVLNRLQDPGNVGTVLRTADAVGTDGVFLCGCCDVYNPKTVRSTMGSLFRVQFEAEIPYEEVISGLRAKNITVCAAVVDKTAKSLREYGFPDGAAVVIGNEGSGLSEEEAALCSERLTIKMSGNAESLNAATAAALFLWELCRGG